jgi:hypothetical protein
MEDNNHSGLEKAARAMAQSTIINSIKKENNSAGVPGACTSHINHQCSLLKDHEGLHRVVGTRLAWSNTIENKDCDG